MTLWKISQILALIVVIMLPIGCSKFPPSEFEIAQVKLGSAYDLHVDDNYAFVSYNKGIAVIDISDLTLPKLVSNVDSEEALFGILVEQDIAYTGNNTNGLSIVDLQDRLHPKEISELDFPGSVYGLFIDSTLLYVSTLEGTFYIIDKSSCESPELIAQIDCEGNGTNLSKKNDLVYYANARVGLQLIDVSAPDMPEVLGIAGQSYGAWDIDIAADHLYLGQHNRGFSIYKIKEDGSLQHISSTDNGGEVYGIAQEGDKLYIADLQQGVEIWDISDKNNPVLLISIEEYAPHDIQVKDGIIFLADQDRNFVILDVPH